MAAFSTVCFGCYSVFKFDSSAKHAYTSMYISLTLTHSIVSYIHLVLHILNLFSLANTELYSLTSDALPGKMLKPQW